MSLNSKVILSLLAGTFSALLAWVLIDFNGVWRLAESGGSQVFLASYAEQAPIGAIFGICVGMAIGLVNGLSDGSIKRIQRNIAWGAAVGLAGGLLGLFFGQLFFGFFYKDPKTSISFSALGPLVFIWDVLVRAFGWALIGLFLGLVQGLPTGSKKAARHGAVGGFVGGMLGGTLFEIVPYILPPGTRNPGIISRGFGMVVTGAAIGFFIGLVETLLKQAWIRVVQGRNEGKEYVISKPRTTIGRDELSDIGLYGDRNISPLHAVIELQGGRHVLTDAGTPIGVVVNGQRMATHVLRDGDVVEVASMRLEFHEKATASKIAAPVDQAKPAVKIPSMDGICPFCGTKKDPKTGACACSVGSTPIAQPPMTPMPPSSPSPSQWQNPSTVAMQVSAPGGGPRLVAISGPHSGQVFPLSSSTMRVGREPDQDIQLPMDSTVSRKHARVENEGGAFVVYDEGSSNGTTVNGTRVTRQQISPGDTVEFGSSMFRFEQ